MVSSFLLLSLLLVVRELVLVFPSSHNFLFYI
jgi:hypothetical protein